LGADLLSESIDELLMGAVFGFIFILTVIFMFLGEPIRASKERLRKERADELVKHQLKEFHDAKLQLKEYRDRDGRI
jgi:Na+-transporting methylmalonyl-CoA/oxaloacetate decarboxylase gamma subunit